VRVPALAFFALTGACASDIYLTSADAGAETSTKGDGGPVGCATDSDCGGTYCDLLTMTCVACQHDDQCTREGSHRCDVALHRCVQCGVVSDCGPNQKCETTTRRCVSSCDSGRMCPASASTCDTARGICVACVTAVGCTTDLAICDPTGGRCVECLTDSQCPSDRRRCDPISGRCARCLSTADCAGEDRNARCDPVRLECTES
jgi:Cys-rich repeat protein